jgi:hypothetical protein
MRPCVLLSGGIVASIGLPNQPVNPPVEGRETVRRLARKERDARRSRPFIHVARRLRWRQEPCGPGNSTVCASTAPLNYAVWWAVGWVGLGIIVTALMRQMRPQALQNAQKIYVEDDYLPGPAAPAHYGEHPEEHERPER